MLELTLAQPIDLFQIAQYALAEDPQCGEPLHDGHHSCGAAGSAAPACNRDLDSGILGSRLCSWHLRVVQVKLTKHLIPVC